MILNEALRAKQIQTELLRARNLQEVKSARYAEALARHDLERRKSEVWRSIMQGMENVPRRDTRGHQELGRSSSSHLAALRRAHQTYVESNAQHIQKHERLCASLAKLTKTTEQLTQVKESAIRLSRTRQRRLQDRQEELLAESYTNKASSQLTELCGVRSRGLDSSLGDQTLIPRLLNPHLPHIPRQSADPSLSLISRLQSARELSSKPVESTHNAPSGASLQVSCSLPGLGSASIHISADSNEAAKVTIDTANNTCRSVLTASTELLKARLLAKGLAISTIQISKHDQSASTSNETNRKTKELEDDDIFS